MLRSFASMEMLSGFKHSSVHSILEKGASFCENQMLLPAGVGVRFDRRKEWFSSLPPICRFLYCLLAVPEISGVFLCAVDFYSLNAPQGQGLIIYLLVTKRSIAQSSWGVYYQVPDMDGNIVS